MNIKLMFSAALAMSLLYGCSEMPDRASTNQQARDTSVECGFNKKDLETWWDHKDKTFSIEYYAVRPSVGVRKTTWSGACINGLANGMGVLTVEMNEKVCIFSGMMTNGRFRGAVGLVTRNATNGETIRNGINYLYDGKNLKTERDYQEFQEELQIKNQRMLAEQQLKKRLSEDPEFAKRYARDEFLDVYRRTFAAAESSSALAQFISTYRNDDPDKLIPRAEKKRVAALARERAEDKLRLAREREERRREDAGRREQQKNASSSTSSSSSSRSGNFQLHPYPKQPERPNSYTTSWGATCESGGYAFVRVADDSRNIYCRGGSHSPGGCDVGIGVEAALAKACRGE